MPTATTPRSRAKRGEGDKLRAKILDQAERLLRESGSPEAVSIRTIAQRCEVTPPAVYLHFSDKETLFQAVCSRRFDELDERIGQARRSAADPLDELRAVGMAVVDFGLEYPEAYRIVMMTSGSGEAPRVLHQVISSVEGAAAAGALDDVDPRAAALVMLAGINGLTASMISFPKEEWGDKQALIEHTMDVLIEGLLSA